MWWSLCNTAPPNSSRQQQQQQQAAAATAGSQYAGAGSAWHAGKLYLVAPGNGGSHLQLSRDLVLDGAVAALHAALALRLADGPIDGGHAKRLAQLQDDAGDKLLAIVRLQPGWRLGVHPDFKELQVNGQDKQ